MLKIVWFVIIIFKESIDMATERTISIIKPDAVAANVIGEIYHRFEKDGLISHCCKKCYI